MSVKENKELARKYHNLNPDDIESLLASDCVGYHPDGSTWNRDIHKQFWSSEETRGIKDIVHVQVAEGEWVATRFTRTGMYQGKHFALDMMAFKRFEDGKIVEVWEQYDRSQLEE